MLLFSVLNFSACSSGNVDTVYNMNSFFESNTSALSTLTITKVKKPWYAWKALVVGKMEKSFPEYSNARGLEHKYYSITEDHKYFGGIYLWKSEEDSKNWFNQAWFDRTKKKYGVQGIVLSFQIQLIKTFSLPQTNKGNFCAVLSYSENVLSEFSPNTKGLFQIIELKDSNQKKCYLTLWENKKIAISFFNTKPFDSEYFEVPLILNNRK